ncbi:MAG: squalene/phytoene synthase family protein [Planctomycetota bacterium]
MKTRELIQFDDNTLDRGYRSCRAMVKKELKRVIWPASNIAGENRRGVDAILAHLLTTIDLLDLESSNGLSLDVWHEIRDDLSDAFLDKYANTELAALVDTFRRFDIPKQFAFDPLRGADLWIRTRKFETFDELEAFCSYVGGSTMASLVPVVGFVKPDWELPAIACGKAVMLTQILANCVEDMKRNRVFIAQEDLKSCEVDVSRLKLRRPTQSFRYLVRLYVKRLEPLFEEAGKLVSYMDYDGRRSLASLLAYQWKVLSKMQLDPDAILSPDGVLSMTESLSLRSRHLLGMKQKAKIIPEDDHH